MNRTEAQLYSDLVGVLRAATGQWSPGPEPERVRQLVKRLVELASAEPATPPGPPPVSEWYRIDWTERSVEHQTAFVSAAQLAELASDGETGGAGQTPNSRDPESMAWIVAEPEAYNLDNRLADLDLGGQGDLHEFDRFDIEISPVSEQQMHVAGHYPNPLRCFPCGALCHWNGHATGAGYIHTDDASWPRGRPPQYTSDAEWAAYQAQHAAGQPVNDADVAEDDGSLYIQMPPDR